VIQVGLGAIGVATAKVVRQKSSVQLVGAVDVNPEVEADLGVPIFRSVAECVRRQRADVAIVTTSSKFLDILEHLREVFRAGLHVVSSCEEMLFPWHRYPKEAEECDRAARRAAVACVGTGVNPGFVMDTLPVVISGACQQVERVRVWRVQDVAKRRPQLGRKVGAGLSARGFRQLVAEGKLGHVGLQESLALAAHGLGWRLDSIREVIRPVIARRDCGTKYIRVKAGQVAGVWQVASGMKDGKERVRLDLRMYMGAPEPRDEIIMDGVPPMHVVIPGATRGDLATAAMLVNCVPRIAEAEHGLRTMLEIAPPRCVP
jgi:4-hydroxy-tetrahydrodipicolinate reductase